MSISTDAQICFGIMFEEDYEFPWNDQEDSDIEEWWIEVNNYTPPFEIWTAEGEQIDGVTPEQRKVYYDTMYAWEENNPIPVTEVNYCSADYPMIILAVPRTVITVHRGYPTELEYNNLQASVQEVKALEAFCKKYELEGSKPKWWLSSYWG